MKKIIYTLAIGTMALIACKDEPSYTIHGTIVIDQEIKIVYLEDRENFNLDENIYPTVLDSAQVIDGKFTFTGRQDSARFLYISPVGKEEYIDECAFFLENGNINVNLGYDWEKYSVTGTPNNDLYQRYRNKEITFEDILENYTQTAVGIEFFSRISQNDKLALKIIPKLPESCLGNPKVQQVIEKFR